MKCGIVGLPNVGKSSLFNALSGKENLAESSNYPFCTIEPNIQQVPVFDQRLYDLAKLENSKKIVPINLNIVDIAGIVKGAHEGEGLGNAFLSNIREVDVIIHVIRCFENKNIHHITGQIDPITDLEVIENELLLSDLQSVENRLKKEKTDKSFFQSIEKHMLNGVFMKDFECKNEDELQLIKEMNFITMKPFLYVCNVADYDNSENYEKVVDYVKKNKHNCEIVQISTKLEEDMNTLNDEERQEFLSDFNIKQNCFEILMSALYNLLNRITFFTVGPEEARAWSIRKQTSAKVSANCIHSDISKGFINAEIINYKVLIASGSRQAAKENGKMRIEGSKYIVQDGDVILFNHR